MTRYYLQNKEKFGNMNYVCKLSKSKLKNNNFMNKSLSKWLLSAFFMFAGLATFGQTLTPSASTLNGCEDEAIQFFANAPGATSYTWSFGDAGPSTSNKENPVFSYSTAGSYTVTLTAIRNGVSSSASLQIVINPLPKFRVVKEPIVTQCFAGNEYCFWIIADDSICGPNKMVFTDGELKTIPALAKGDSFKICKKFTINGSQTTSYDMTVEVTSCNGCTAKKDFAKVAEVIARLGLSFTSTTPRGCDSVKATFVNNSFVARSDVKRFIWFFGDGEVDSTSWAAAPGSLDHWYRITGPDNGNFITKLYVETISGCSDTFIFNASATNFVLNPRIIADRDSTCLDDSELNFTLTGGPPRASLTGGFLWNFGDNFMDNTCSGCNFNNADYPEASYEFGKLGPFEIVLAMSHNICGTIVVRDTIQIIGPSTVMEDPPNGILIAQNHRYQCVIQDTVQFTNLSTFYHNDENWIDDDSAYVWSRTDTFKMLDGEHGLLNASGDTLYIYSEAGGVYTFLRTRYLPPNQRFHDGELVHHFADYPMQEAYDVNRGNRCIVRIWDFADPYSPKCTTDTRAGINVGKNCSYSMDTLPKHWYHNWDSIMAYDVIRPMSIGIFNSTTQACSRKNVWYHDSVAIIKYIHPFMGKDSFYEIGQGGTYIQNDSFYRWIVKGDTFIVPALDYVNKKILLPKKDSLTLDTIPFPFYIPGHHELVKVEKYGQIQPADSVDAALYRRLFYNTIVRCFTVELKHFDTCHPFKCESVSNLSLALTPPRAKGVRWSGIRCLAPPSPPYGIVFNVQNTKPGCTQDHLEFNFDSASGINNWVPMIGGLFPGSAPPPPPLPVMPYVPQGAFPTSFVYLYTANNLTDRKTGWVTVGTVVGNGITTTMPCYDTVFYHRMLKFRFADATFTITRPVPRAQNDKAACRWDSIYFKMNNLVQPDVEIFSFTWGDGNRHVETKKSYDTAQSMKKYFLDRINEIEKYISDTGDLGGRLSPYAAYKDSVSRGWTPSRVFDATDSLYFNLRLTYPKDSIEKWLRDPNSLIGWNVIERQVNADAIKQQARGQQYTATRIERDTFLTSLVIDYKVNTIIAPEITPLIIEIFNQLGFDYFDIPSDQIAKFFGPRGSGKCIDTTGYSNFISFEYEETSPAGIKRFSSRDTNINSIWYHQYQVSGIHSPLVLTRTRIDGCVQISSLPIKVGIGKEVIFSDTVLCRDNPVYALANYWYWSTLLPWEITDITDYWRIPARIINNKEKPTRWDWAEGDAKEYEIDNDYGGLGLGNNPPWFNRYRPSGPGAGITINKNLVNGKLLGTPSAIYYKTAGVYKLGILAEDSNGCKDTTKQDIYVTDVEAKFGFSNNRPQCKTLLELLDSSFVIDGCVISGNPPCDSIVNWVVDWGDGSPLGGKNNQNRDAKLGHDYTRNGTFTVKLIVTSVMGCIDTFERILIVPGPIPVFEPLTLKICAGDEICYANKSINPTSSARWIIDYGDGVTEDSKDVNDTFCHQYTTPGVYNVFMTQFDSIPEEGKYCFAIYPDTSNGQQALITVEVVQLDSTNIIADDTIVCIGQPIVFSNTTRNPDDTAWVAYKWIFDIDNAGGDSVTSGDSTITYAYWKASPPGQPFRATVVPQYNALLPLPHCPYRDTIRIFVDSVEAQFDWNDDLNDPNKVFTNRSFNGQTYRWWFDNFKEPAFDSLQALSITGGPPAQSTDKDFRWTFDSLGCYWVVLETTSPDGCVDTVTHRVCNTFKFKVTTYNTFTPGVDGDLDGLNDVFDIPIEGHELYELTIYNRYGTKVFESENSENDWNGKLFNTGPMSAEGTYWYHLKYKEERNTEDPKEMYGIITLIRGI